MFVYGDVWMMWMCWLCEQCSAATESLKAAEKIGVLVMNGLDFRVAVNSVYCPLDESVNL